MSPVEDILKKLEQAKDRAKETYEANGRKDYEAGLYDGLKQALEIVDDIKRLG